MAILVYGLPLLAVALAWPAWSLVASRRGIEPAATHRPATTPGRDAARSIICGAAALFGLVAAVYAWTDTTIVARPGLGLCLFAEAATAALLAVFPTRRPWVRARCTAAQVAAAAWLLFAIWIDAMAIMASSCACSGSGASFVLPPLLGVLDTRSLVVFESILVPVLLVIASALPRPVDDRLIDDAGPVAR